MVPMRGPCDVERRRGHTGDTFARVPAATLTRLHMDPEGPTPAVSDSAVLSELPEQAIEALVAAAGPGSGSTLIAAELRQLGGALGRPHRGAGALAMIDGQFVLFGVAIAATPEMAAQGLTDARRLVEALRPWANGGSYLNFAEEPTDTSRATTPPATPGCSGCGRRWTPTG